MPEKEGWISHAVEWGGDTFSAEISQRWHSETAERKALQDVAQTPAFGANSLRVVSGIQEVLSP